MLQQYQCFLKFWVGRSPTDMLKEMYAWASVRCYYGVPRLKNKNKSLRTTTWAFWTKSANPKAKFCFQVFYFCFDFFYFGLMHVLQFFFSLRTILFLFPLKEAYSRPKLSVILSTSFIQKKKKKRKKRKKEEDLLIKIYFLSMSD